MLVLADEATGNLDESSAAAVIATLGELADEGRAVVLVTHEAQSAAAADRVLHLVEGRLRVAAGGRPARPRPVSGALREAWANVRARRGRSLLSGLGIVLVATMLAVAATVSYGLLTGFDRGAAEADLPDVLVSFDSQPASSVRERLAALPDLEAFSLREQLTSVPVPRRPRIGRQRGDRSGRPGAPRLRDRRRPRRLASAGEW